MKLQVSPEWTFLSGFMKANFTKKLEIDEDETHQQDKTGDQFYDYIGKFCNKDSQN